MKRTLTIFAAAIAMSSLAASAGTISGKVGGVTGESPKSPVPLVSVAPASPQPGPMSTVGARRSSGNQCRRIWASSKDVMVKSCSTPATGATAGGAGRSGRHAGRRYAAVK